MSRSWGAAGLLCIWLAAAGIAQQQSPEQLFAEAVKLHQAGQYQAAIKAYEAFLSIQPQAVEALSNLGAVYARLGNYGKAIEQYRKALGLAENPGVRFNLALAYYDSGQFRSAVPELERVLKATPDNTRAAVLLADCRFREGDYKRVIALLTPLEAGAGNNRALLYLLGTALIRDNQIKRGEALVDRILSQGESAEAHLMLGTARMMTLDVKGALTEFEKAVKLNPKLPSVHSSYASAILSLGETARAAEEYRRELEINPNDFESHLMLGVLARKEDQYEEARMHLARALEIRPGTPDAAYQLALVEIANGKLTEAHDRLQDLIRRYPNFTEAHISMATVYYRLKRKDDGDRERELVRKLQSEQQADSIKKQTAALERRNAGVNQPPGANAVQAQTTAEQALAAPAEKPPGQKPADRPGRTMKPPASNAASFDDLAARAAAARDADRFDEAAGLYNRALSLRPLWKEGWWYLGTLFYDRDRYAQARDAFARLVTIDKKAGAAFAMLGLCQFRLNQYEQALIHIEQGRSLGLGDNEDLKRVARFHSAILQTKYGRPDTALYILYALAREPNAASEPLINALGLAGLRLELLPSEIPSDKRALVRLEGQAQFALAGRNRVEAAKQFAPLIEKYPAEPGVHYSYGVFLLAEDSDQALREFKEELKASPKHVPARVQIALEYLRRAEYESGLSYAEEAVKLAPDLFTAHNALGRLLLGLDQTGRAIKELETGVKLAPDSPETHFALAAAYARAGRKEDAARQRAEFSRLDALRRKAGSAATTAEPRAPQQN